MNRDAARKSYSTTHLWSSTSVTLRAPKKVSSSRGSLTSWNIVSEHLHLVWNGICHGRGKSKADLPRQIVVCHLGLAIFSHPRRLVFLSQVIWRLSSYPSHWGTCKDTNLRTYGDCSKMGHCECGYCISPKVESNTSKGLWIFLSMSVLFIANKYRPESRLFSVVTCKSPASISSC